MVDFQYKRRLRRVLYSKISLVILFIAVLLMARSTWRLWVRDVETARTVAALKNEAVSLDAEEKNLSSRVESLKTAEGEEAALREKFRVARPGEGVIVVVDQGGAAGDTGASGAWWDRLMSFFKRFF